MILSLLLAAFASGDVREHASFHAAGADLYFDVPNVRAIVAAYPAVPIVKLMNDDAIAKIAEVAKTAGIDLKSMLGGALPVADPSKPMLWPWSSATHVSLSIEGIDAGPSTGATPARGACAVMDFADSESAAQAAAAIGSSFGMTMVSGADSSTLDFGGQKLELARYEFELMGTHEPAWVARAEQRLYVGVGVDTPEAFVARASKPETSMTKAALTTEEASFTKSSGIVLAHVWSDLAAMPLPASEDARMKPLSDLAQLFAPAVLPLVGTKGHWRLELRNDRFVAESLYNRIGRSQDLDRLFGTTPVGIKAANYVAKEAVGAWVTSVKPGEFETLLTQVLAGFSKESTPALEGPKVSSALGEAAAVFMLPISGLPMGGSATSAIPKIIVSVELKDAAAFESGLQAWIEKLKTTQPELKITSKPFHKMPVYTFDLGAGGDEADGAGGGAGGSEVKPSLGILPDRVVVSISKAAIQGEIKRFENKSTEFHPIAEEGRYPKEAFEVSTMDWPGSIAKLYDMARGMIPMLMQGSDTKFDASKLPTSTELLRFFRPSWSWSKRVDGRIYTYSESSFGPEMPLGMLVLGVSTTQGGGRRSGGIEAQAPAPDSDGAAGATVALDSKQPGKPDENSPPAAIDDKKATTLATLRDLRTGLAVYKSQANRFPAQLTDLLVGTANFPKGFLKGDTVPVDAWGHALVYTADAAGAKYALRSMGADGIDQQGEGDDVRLP